MNNPIFDFVKQNGHLIAAVIAGTCALTAAYIRRDRRWEKSETVPFFGLMVPPLLSIVLGVGCFAAEIYVYNIDPPADQSDPGLGDPGTMLVLIGSVLVAAGLLWGPYNLYRLVTWPRPPADQGEEPPPSVPVATPGLSKVRGGFTDRPKS
jgi:hypothetical protein